MSFKHKTLEEVSDQFLILGDNGTGKTTLLQAIALPLALATKQIERIADFEWPGVRTFLEMGNATASIGNILCR